MGSSISNPPIRLAILETDTPVPGVRDKYKSYGGVFQHLFERACAALDPPQTLSSQLHLSFHDVVANDPSAYPKPEDIDAVLITGSKASAFEDREWIVRLVRYTQHLLEGGRVRVVGVCFGHQIVGRALGAPVRPNARGWELSVIEVELTEEGKQVFGLEKMRIHQMHRDIVHGEPPGVTNLAKTDTCPMQAFYVPKRVITVQGHPEFKEDMVREILDMRRENGILSEGIYEEAMRRVADEHDGVAVAQAFLRFLRD